MAQMVGVHAERPRPAASPPAPPYTMLMFPGACTENLEVTARQIQFMCSITSCLISDQMHLQQECLMIEGLRCILSIVDAETPCTALDA